MKFEARTSLAVAWTTLLLTNGVTLSCERGLGKKCPCASDRGDICCVDHVCRPMGTCIELGSVAGSGGGNGHDGEEGGAAGEAGMDLPAPTALSASTNSPFAVRLRWRASGADPSTIEYVIERDGVEIATVPGTIQNYDDEAFPGKVGAPVLEATRGEKSPPGAVRLSWSEPSLARGSSHRYTVFARSTDGMSARTNGVDGACAASSVQRYEFSRNDGLDWLDAGSSQTFDDFDAPPATIDLHADAEFQFWNAAVQLSVSQDPSVTPSESTYLVRAVTELGSAASSNAAIGTVGIGPIAYTWERSSADGDSDYSALPGVTGLFWFDNAPIYEANRYYRVNAKAVGASGSSAGVPVEARKMSEVSVGADHTCGLLLDSSVRCWGTNASGNASSLEGAFRAVSAGWLHTCGVQADRTIGCWGSNEYGQASPPTGEFIAASAGARHSCGLRPDHSVTCWGGLPPEGAFSGPTGERFVGISVGLFSCGLREDRTAVCWEPDSPDVPQPPADRFNMLASDGYTACGVRTDSETLACWGDAYNQIPTGKFESVAISSEYLCGLRSDKRLSCWLGTQYVIHEGELVEWQPPGTFKSVSGGGNTVCGVRPDDTVRCWGDWSSGVVSVQLSSPGAFTSVVGCNDYLCGLRADHTVACWGNELSSIPSDSTGRFQSLSAGAPDTASNTVCGLKDDRTIACWGASSSIVRNTPDGTFKAVSVGPEQACAIREEDSRVLCWGESVPKPSADRFKSISVGTGTCGINLDDKVVCWGLDAWPPQDQRFQSVSVDTRRACGVQLDGSLACWGKNWDDSPAPPPGKFSAVATAHLYECGLHVDGQIACWGHLPPIAPSALLHERFKGVVASFDFACGITLDDKILCWANGNAI
jgi:hypothetical protein